MAREVSVKITANTSGFNSGMDQAGSKAAQTAAKIKASFDSGLTGISKNSRSINTLSSGLGKVGFIAAVGFGAAIKSAADFDQAMSSVAATGSDARANMSALRDAAIKAGADTKFSATEAAGGVEALAKAGVSAKDTLGGGLTGALNLAAAGNLDVGSSAEVAASAMNQFGLAGKDIPHIADLLAQGAGVAQGEVSDMAAALQQSGLVANQFGLSIDETAQSLSLFAKNGLVGSDAGTSFKTMLTSLYAPTSTGAKALGDLGVSAYDAAGQLKPIGVLADDLKGKLDGLTAQDRNAKMRAIFGSDAIRAGTILLKDGSAGLSQMASDFGKFGSAADVARTKMDNLKGDLEQLKGSFETALIGLGEGGQGPLRGLVQNITGAVNAFNKLGSGTKSTILAIGGIGAASALGVAGVGKLAVFAADAYSAFGRLSSSLPRLAGAMRTLGIASGIAVGAFIALRAAGTGINALMGDNATTTEQAAQALAGLSQTASSGASSLDSFFSFSTKGGIVLGTESVNSLGEAFGRLENRDGLTKFNDGLTGLVSNLTGVQGPAGILTDRFSQLDDRLAGLAATNAPAAAQGFTEIAKAAAAQNVPLDKLVALFPQYAAAVRAANDANGGTITTTQQLVDAMSNGVASAAAPAASALEKASAAIGAIGSSSGGAVADLQALSSALFDTGNAALGVSNAQIGYEAAVDAAAAAAKKNGQNLKVSTAAGRENQSALNNLASAGENYVQSLVATGESSKKVKAATQDARGEFIKQAVAMGKSKSAAADLANAAGLIPKDVVTKYEAKTDTAKAELGKVTAAIKGLPKKQQVEVMSAYKKGGIEAAQAKIAELMKKPANPVIEPKVKAQQMIALQKAIKDLPKKQQVEIKSAFNSGGLDAAKAKIEELTGQPANIDVTTSVDTSNLNVLKQFENPINTVVNVTPSGVDATNSQIDTTARPRTTTTRVKPVGVGATNSQIDTTARGRREVTRVSASGVGATNALINTTQRGRHATTSVSASGVGKVNSQINSTQRTRTALVRAVAAGVGAVQSAINSIHGKTVTVHVNKTGSGSSLAATGGLMTHAGVLMRGPLRRSNGGPVWGAGTATSDSIPALLSNGEFVINAKSVRAIGAETLARMNATGLATGGPVGFATGGPVGLTTDREVLRAVTAQFHVDQARNLAERRKADVELAKAMKKLNDTQSAALDSIKSLSTSLQEPYRSKSTDVDDVLAAMKDGAKDISAFGSQVKQLKAMGLQQGVIDQITADGAVNGGELAGQILAGGQGLVDALNKANDDLTKAGTALGKTSVGLVQDAPAGKPKKTPKKKALGGYLDGPGSGTSDSIPLLASNGEYVVNAAATAANRSVLDAINYGRAQINEHRFMPAYAGGHSMAPQQVDRSFHEGSMVLQYQGDLERGLRLAQAAKRDNLTMARLTGAV